MKTWIKAPKFIRKRVKQCPACGGKSDGYGYTADTDQRELGYPILFKMCACCQCPMVEVGLGHGLEFKQELR